MSIQIKMEDALIEYMKKHDQKDIVLYVKVGSGCCTTSFLMAKARFVKPKDRNLAERGYTCIETEVGKIYYQPDELIFEQNAQLLINRFFGKVVIQPMGIYAADERYTRCNPAGEQ